MATKRSSKESASPFDDWIGHAGALEALLWSAESFALSADDDDDGETFEIQFNPQPLSERFDKLKFQEKLLQRYVCENAEALGFRSIRGPFPIGPDVHVKVGRRWVHAEVEVAAANYFKHGHHRDPNFAKVEILIVPEQVISAAHQARLPARIVRIQRQPFVDWWEENRRGPASVVRGVRLRERALGAIYGDLAHRIENSEIIEQPCRACDVTVTHRVELSEPGFRDPTDREELACPRCGVILSTARGTAQTLIALVDGVRPAAVRSGSWVKEEEEEEEEAARAGPPRRRRAPRTR